MDFKAISSMGRFTINRAMIYAVLILFALYFLFPIYVMVSTSFKDLDELRTGIC